MITLIDNNPARVPKYSDVEFLKLAEALAGNQEATCGEFTAAVIRRLIRMAK